jgi:hypothetical protein
MLARLVMMDTYGHVARYAGSGRLLLDGSL